MDKTEITNLLIRFRLGLCNKDECDLIESWYEKRFTELVKEGVHTDYTALRLQTWEKIEKTMGHEPVSRPKTVKKIIFWAIASVAAVLIIFFEVMPLQKPTVIDWKDKPISDRYKNDISPGTGGGYISFDNERLIDLKKSVKMPADIRLEKDGFYKIIDRKEPGRIVLSTNKGQNLTVLLPDGTRAWLNAGSQLVFHFPFMSATRDVSLSGEAYFEVAKDKKRPFNVKCAQSVITVLGTHFNVQTYMGQKEEVALLEGAVKVQSKLQENQPVLMKPGQKVDIDDTKIQLLNSDNVQSDIAWTQGYFSFNNAPLNEVMAEIANWYNLNIVYEGDVPKETFFGELDKSSNLSGILRVLEKSGVKFLIQGHTVTVL